MVEHTPQHRASPSQDQEVQAWCPRGAEAAERGHLDLGWSPAGLCPAWRTLWAQQAPSSIGNALAGGGPRVWRCPPGLCVWLGPHGRLALTLGAPPLPGQGQHQGRGCCLGTLPPCPPSDHRKPPRNHAHVCTRSVSMQCFILQAPQSLPGSKGHLRHLPATSPAG